jgi:hypothetical protein
MSASKKLLVVGLLLLSTVAVPSASTLAEGEGEGPAVMSELYSVFILDAYAVTEVERVLYNPGSEAMDHTFVFTIPQGALISNFSVELAGVTYYADVLEKDEADQLYNQSVATGSNAGLVASRGNDVFTYSVSIQAEEEMTATIRYEQVLLKENGWHTYLLPIGSDGDNVKVGMFGVDVTIESPSTIDTIRTVGYDNIVEALVKTPLEGSVSAHAINTVPDEDLEVMWRTRGGTPEGKMYFGSHDGSGYFVHVLDPDPSHFDQGQVPKDFIFVLDKSGSMRGTKFTQATTALDYIYGSLSPADRFSFVEFNDRSSVYNNDLEAANSDNLEAVREHIDTIVEGGGTNIHSGVCDALDVFKAAGDTVPIIVLLTDGKANSGLYERSTFRDDVRQKNTVDASIYTIALGNEADWTFCEALALENDGRAIWVTEDQDVVLAIKEFVMSFSSPLLAQLSFDYGPRVTDIHPEEVPAHFEGSEVLVTGRFPMTTTEIPMSLRAVSPDGNLVTDNTFAVEPGPGQDFVPRFWAFQRIRDLEDRMKYNGTDDATIEEITQLAIDFHFATDYTSLFVELPEGVSQTYIPDPGSVDHSLGYDGALSGSNDPVSNKDTPYSGGSRESTGGTPDPSASDSAYPLHSSPSTEADESSLDASIPMGVVVGAMFMMIAIPIMLVVYVVVSHRRRSPPEEEE